MIIGTMSIGIEELLSFYESGPGRGEPHPETKWFA